MQVAVAYAEPTQQIWLRIEVPEETTVEQAIIKSGLLRQFPDLDLTERAVGIFGKLVKLDAELKARGYAYAIQADERKRMEPSSSKESEHGNQSHPYRHRLPRRFA